MNLNQQSQIDLNFAERPLFTLPGEGNRPVYVNPTSIFPTTGAIISSDARKSPDFAQVTDYLSDLTSHSTQATIGISPLAFNSAFQWSVTYVWQKVTEETRGFSGGSTAGDPFDLQWSRGARDARHQITYNVGYTFHQAVSVTAFGRFQSGNPFTPVVSSDINGDGYNNDRAFIYDPSKTADPTLAAEMQNLLTHAPSSVRNCLEKQINTVAGQNSCEGPWSTSLSLRIALVSQALKLPDRATISLGIANPLTGIDALVHGSEQPARLGRAELRRSDAAPRPRLRSGDGQLQVRREPAFRREPPGEPAAGRADAAHARRARRRRAGARAPGSLPPPAVRTQRARQQAQRERRFSSSSSARTRIRSSRCCGSRTRSG